MRLACFIALLTAACTGGPGRPPDLPDASEPIDMGFVDTGPQPDTGPRDAGFPDFGPPPDAGPPPMFDFTGIFGILGDGSQLFAREVDDRLMLIIGDFPYVYVGTIDEAGTVDVTSHVLERSGCANARITGTYDRVATTYDLRHQTCNLMGQPLDGMIRGGFAGDYGGGSGIYELTATVTQDLLMCATFTGTETIRVGLNLLSTGTVGVFTGVDVIDEPAVYLGTVTGNGSSISTTFRIDVSGSQTFGLSAILSQLNANDPVQWTGERDVWDPAQNCSFRISLEGERVSGP